MTIAYTVDDGYITLPITVDPNQIMATALKNISTSLPGWVPRESHIEVLLLEQMAAMVSESATVAAQVPMAIFSVFGSLVGINPIQGQAATATTTWTMADAAGYTIKAGTVVAYQVLGNQTFQFQTVSQFTVPTGQTTATGIIIQAQEVGVAFNGITTATPLVMGTSLSYISSVTPLVTTSGGVDPETTALDLDRLSNELHYLTPRPILPADFAALAANVTGVHRATAFNGLNPFGNVLNTADGLFRSTVWAGSATNCTVAEYTSGISPNAMRITGTGSGNASIITATNSYTSPPPYGYAIAPLQNYVGLIQLQLASVAKNVVIQVSCFDDAGNSTGTFSSSGNALAVDSTTVDSIFWVGFTAPAKTFTAEVEVFVNSIVSTTHDVYAAALMQCATPTNLVSDSSFVQVNSPTALVNPGALTWTLSNAALSVAPYLSGINGILYTSAGGTPTYTATSLSTFLVAGTYTITAKVDATAVASGAVPSITLSSVGGTVSAISWNTPITAATANEVVGTFTVTTGSMVAVVLSTNGATVTSGQTVSFAEPQILAGDVHTSPPVYSVGPTFSQPGTIYNQERTVTVAAVDINGEALSSTINTTLGEYLESQREVNFIVNAISPTYTPITVQWSGVCYSTVNPADVLAAANAAVASYLDPATWGQGAGTPLYWDPSQTSVWYLSIVTLLGETPGMQHLTSVKIGYSISSGTATLTTADLTLPGFAPMPAWVTPPDSTYTGPLSTISGSVISA